MQVLNYKVYYMSKKEKLLYSLLAFAIGAAVGFLFYGGIGKDDLGQPTTITYVLNVLIPCVVGVIAAKLFLPIRTKQIINNRRKQLNSQFRDMLDGLSTAIGSGKNVVDSFIAVNDDLKVQYAEGTFILNELQVVLAGLENNLAIEDILADFGKRSGIKDIESFASVFQTCYRKGGNIKDVVRNSTTILGDKMEIREELETLVSSSKMEQYIMIVMPVILIAMIKMMSPEFASNFVSGSGIISTTIAIVMFVIAYFVGKKILDISI
ncbi:MAG: type II secretion system F family protein [Clostridia bacterium]|nr:type II secretion system F family protein [Clostridia bacterium]